MSRKKGVHLVEKLLESKGDKSLEIRVKILEAKNRENRGYSTLHDTMGVPIVKLVYRDKRYSKTDGDGRAKRIAGCGIIKQASVNFNKFEGYVIRSHFLLTDEGYHVTRQFLLEDYSAASIDEKSSDITIIEPYNINLWHRRKILLVDTRLDLSDYPEIEMVEQPIEGPGINKVALKPRFTTPAFNQYVFDILKQTYSQFSAIFLNTDYIL